MKNTCKSSGIGGQAVLEGIMMKNQEVYSIGVRKPDGEIEVNLSTHEGIGNKKLKRIPIIRGVINFVDSLVLGMRCLTFSASFYDEEESQPSKADVLLQKLFKDRAEKLVMGITVAFSIVMAVAIFMVLPYYLADILRQYIVSDTVLAVVEGAIRLLLFISYVLLISRMKDIQRVFQYHGAEHKCINCIETGLELNVENVRVSSKHHKYYFLYFYSGRFAYFAGGLSSSSGSGDCRRVLRVYPFCRQQQQYHHPYLESSRHVAAGTDYKGAG